MNISAMEALVGEKRRLRFLLAAMALFVLGACSSAPRDQRAQKAGATLDKVQGKIQVLTETFGSADATLNEGQPVVYLWQGVRRYTLFFRKPMDVVHGKEYVVEGVNAQRVIDEIGDPDEGRNGYPLLSSCERVVRTAWNGLPFDDIDARASALRTRVKRYPARPVFLVMRISPASPAENDAAADREAGGEGNDETAPVVSVAAEKQRAALIAGPGILTAPLWEPAGGTVRCPVVIDGEGKISELGTGIQLCEAVPWSQFRYRPLVQAGHPVTVKTEVEVSFKPHN
jgi:hypothetical protein